MDPEKCNNNNKTDVTKAGASVGVRHVQYALMFVAMILGYGTRTVLNVAVVAMVSTKSSEYFPTYPEWKSKKNLMLSSFFWGYICLQIGAGQLAKKYGPKLFLGSAMFVASVFTILVPLFGDKFGYGGIIFCRVLQGACQGFLLPSMSNLLSAWTHITERARWGGRVYSGQAFGNVVAMPITGLICASKYGWPLIFYIYGGVGVAWCILWIFFGADDPLKHKSISEGERIWLENENINHNNDQDIKTPWRSIFTSLPFIAIIIAHSGENWGYWTLLTEIPSYMNDILGFDIASNSLLSALPYLAMCLLNIVMSSAADKLIDKRILSLEMSRKLFNSIAFFVPAVGLIILGFLNTTNQVVVITILVISVAFNAGEYCGFMINHIDLSPNHAGTLMAITNSIATIFSIIAPLAVDLVGSISGYKENDVNLWNIVFFIAAGVHVVAGIAFDVLGSGEIQAWNYPPDAKNVKPVDEIEKKVLRKISKTMFS